MGNSNSSANPRPTGVPGRRIDAPPRPTQPLQSSSSSPPPNTPHPSMRTKKKSLELPDLASLALSSSQGSPYSASAQYGPQLPTSSPIPIPVSPHVSSASRTRPQHEFPSTQQMPDAYIAPSTHIPIPPHQRPRGNPHIRGAPMPYNSTRSFASRAQYANQPTIHESRQSPPVFVSETVHSTIPIALKKAKQELVREAANADATEEQQLLAKKNSPPDDPKDPIPVKISWHRGGKSVMLARAGDDNWKGRRPMEREEPNSDQNWFIWVDLLPGTHHFRFLVDDHWRIADELPTAVDDLGGLANYVAVGLNAPPSASMLPASPAPSKLQAGQSFWSTSSSTGDGPNSSTDGRRSGPPRWTSEFPLELLAAAREEELYLAASSSVPDSASVCSVPAPNIPPAPTLPRHLDKLILNVKPSSLLPTPSRVRDKEDRKGSSRKVRSALGMTNSSDMADAAGPSGSGRAWMDVTGSADDTSVLPVPSHVVLQHLSTSAIRNGVLAVGNTTRYREKYLTTIYYKPT